MRAIRIAGVLCLLGPLPGLAATTDIAGWWEMSADLPNLRQENRLIVEAAGEGYTGQWGRFRFEITSTGNGFELRCPRSPVPDWPCGSITLRVKGDRLEGDGTLLGVKTKVSGKRPAKRRAAGPRTFTYEPDRHSMHFSGNVPPVLTLQPGDTVRTLKASPCTFPCTSAVRCSSSETVTPRKVTAS